MITALIQFKLPKPVTRAQAQEIFLSTAPKYREIPGLIRKYYLLSLDEEYFSFYKLLDPSLRSG